VPGDRLRNPRDRRARAARILDATAQLVLRYGCRRVTVDDIARQADIGKGTVYLHWKTRDDVFCAVVEREGLAALDELLDTLRRDRGAWMLHRLARTYFLAIMRRPLLRALFLEDAELLGKVVRTGNAREQRHQLVSGAYFTLLSRRGLLRDDLSPDAAAYAFMAILEGFIRAEMDADGSGVEDRSHLLALTVERAFESGRQLPAADEQAVAGEIIALFTDLGTAGRVALGVGGRAALGTAGRADLGVGD
jgi:AcrR family transcriptional regulator